MLWHAPVAEPNKMVFTLITPNIETPQLLTILVLKFEQVHCATFVSPDVSKIFQLKDKKCSPRSDAKIWFYTVCSDLSI